MPLTPGARLGPYEIVGLIGAGGMGEVYKARDTRLDRTVAVKVLPSACATEPTLRARFEREARAISALEHPHICTLHDLGEENGQAFLVMEHLSGETLAERLKKGALPLAQALEIGAQVAEALAAAHKHDIVHRDLKPGNVMLTRTGAKLLDFGLARLVQHGEHPVVEDLTSAPTEPTPLTGRGTILGTIPYMAPEQLEGKLADPRTDLWALGAILYEMVTGRRAFEGTSQVSLIGAILEREPAPLASQQPLTPPSLERLVKRCLAKSPDDRWDSAHDVADELRWIAGDGAGPVPRGGEGRTAARRWVLMGVGLLAAGAAIGVRLLRPTPAPPDVVRSLLDVRPAEELNSAGVGLPGVHHHTAGGSRSGLTWTPDGRALVFVGRQGGLTRLYLRELNQDQARPLSGTEGAQVLAVLPDERRAAFWADGAIRMAQLDGGPVTVLTEAVPVAPSGIACTARGDVFYDGADGVIWRAATEREPSVVTRLLAGEVAHTLPALLRDGRVLLYTVRKREWTWGDEEIVAQDLATGERTIILRDAVDARYVPGGHLAFLRRGTLFAVAFDALRLEVRGDPVALQDQVSQALTAGHSRNITGAGHFSVASTGALAFVAAPVRAHPEWTLAEVDRRGRTRPLPAPRRSYAGPTDLSPDGRHLAVNVHGLTEEVIWLYDVARGTLDRLTPEGEAFFPRWTPDGHRVAFTWNGNGGRGVAWQRTDGSAPPELLVPVFGHRSPPSSWSPDGRQLALVKDNDIWAATVEGSQATVRRVTHTPQTERWPALSPDGRWLAYGSDVSGRFEVYVQPWPGPGPREQVSLDGGESPAWRSNGRELFFLSPQDETGCRRMMVVDTLAGPSPSFGTPRPLFDFSFPELRFACEPARCYSVAPDGQRFYVTRLAPQTPAPPVTHIHLVQNWTEDLKARVPGGTIR